MNSQATFHTSGEFKGRLKLVRKEMCLNQTDFAALGGVVLNSQSRYESGTNEPSFAYLANLAASGVDVRFLLTGQRSPDSLDPRAEQMLSTFLELPGPLQDAMLTSVTAIRAAVRAGSPENTD